MSSRPSLAKVSRPRLFGVVPRVRLFSFLDENHGRPLVWISGPPGAGKTALVASYLEDRGVPTVWYQIDAGDADPASLFHYLAVAAESLAKGETASLPRFAPEHLSDLPSFARLFFRAFFAQLPEGLMLVLDNYQEAAEGTTLDEILRQATAEVPPGNSVIAISRVEAPRTFVQLAASGTMAKMGWEELQLTLDEVRAIAVKRNVTDDWLVQALHQQSQGWAAGITLMLERLGHFDGTSRELPTETRESVFNYFASLIFDQAPETTRHILLSVAFLPRVTPTLARELSGRDDASTILEDLYRRRMFTDRRPGTEHVYQFHALFLDFLSGRARQTFAAEDLDELLRRSACALESAGDVDAAMEIWLEARNWNEAIRVAIKEANSLLNTGRRQTLVRWIQEIPESVAMREPWIVYWLGRAQLQTSPGEGIKTLEDALELFRRSDDRQGRIETLATLLGGAFLGFGALDAMDRWLDELLAQIELSPTFLSAAVELRIWGVLCVTLFYVRPWHPLTVTSYRRVEELLPNCTDPSVVLTAATGALAVSFLCGDLEFGDRIAIATEPFASRDGASPSEGAWWYGQVGYLRLMEARYEEAIDSLRRGNDIAKSNGLRAVVRVIMLWRFTVEFRVLGWSVANATLSEIEAMPGPNRPMEEAMLCLYQGRRAIQRHQYDEAAMFAGLSVNAVMRAGSRLEEMILCLTNADILLAAKRVDEVSPLLSRVRALVERAPVYDCWRAVLEFTQAWYVYVQGGRESALVKLSEALALAREGRRRNYLRLIDSALRPLFCLALDEGIEVDLVQDIIRMFRLRPPHDAPDLWPWPVRIFTLGRFEVQVNGKPMEFSRKLPRKTLLLLKAIVALGGRDVPEQALCDVLWGDEEGDAAHNALSITVLRLRKLLGSNESVLQQGGKVSLNPEFCWVDAWVFEARPDDERSANGKVLNLYGGTFLPEDVDASWSVPARERLRGKFIHALSAHGATLESQGDLEGASQYYLRGIDADPIVEFFHQGLMRCYERTGKRTEAFSAYRRLKHTLSVVLGVPPSDATQRLFQDMLQRQTDEGSLLAVDASAAGSVEPFASNVTRGVVAKLPLRRSRSR